MNIKKVEKICKEWKRFTLIDQRRGDQIIQWIRCGGGTYSLEGMPYMLPYQLLNMFGISGEAQNRYQVNVIEKTDEEIGCTYHWPDGSACEADPMDLIIGHKGAEWMFFTCDFCVMTFEPDYIAPFNIKECTFEMRWKGDACWMVVKEGVFTVAVILPAQTSVENVLPGKLRSLADGMKRAAAWREMAAQQQRELEWAESHPGEQIEMGTEGEVLAECT